MMRVKRGSLPEEVVKEKGMFELELVQSVRQEVVARDISITAAVPSRDPTTWRHTFLSCEHLAQSSRSES